MPSLLHILVMFGLCFGFQNKLPFLHGRLNVLDRLLKCSYCMGFHCGWLTWLLTACANGDLPAHGWVPAAASLALWAFIGAASCYLLDALAKWVEDSVPAFKDYVRVIAAAHGFAFDDEEEADGGEE